MGYKNAYPIGTNFCGVQKVEMGYCTSKWGADGNPGAHCFLSQQRKTERVLDVYRYEMET